MVVVPFRDDARVAPEGGTPAISSVSAPQNVSNRQLSALGGALTQAGAAGAKIMEQELREANQLKVEEALSKAKQIQNDLTFDEQFGYSFVRGDATFDRESGMSLSEEYGQDFDKELDNIADGLSNDAQRNAFALYAQRMSSGFRGEITKHEAKEYETWAVSVKQGVIDTLKRDVALHYDDPEKTQKAIDGIRGAMRDLVKFAGKDQGNYLENAVREQVSDAHMLAVGAMLEDNNASAAEDYINKHRDELTEEDLFRADVAIGREQDVQIATEAANDYINDMLGNDAESGPQEFIMPVANAGVRYSPFGQKRGNRNHGGVDFPVPVGSKVSAAADGVVKYVGNRGKYGNLVIIDHGGGMETRYAHLSGFDAKKGDVVRRGQIIAKTGGARGAPGSGNSTGPHLHYEVRVNGVAQDPMKRHTVQRGKGKSLADVLLAMRNDPRLAGNPQRLAEAERQVRSVYDAVKHSEAEQKQDARDAAFEALLKNGGQYNKLPASVRDAVKGSDLPGLLSFAGEVQKALAGPSPKSGSPLWAYTKSDIADGRISNVAELNQMRPYLSDADYKDLVGDIIGLNNGDSSRIDSIKTANSAIKYIDTELQAIGIDTTPSGENMKQQAEALGAFKSALYQQIAAAERAKGSKLTGDEARKIGLSLIGETSQRTDGSWLPFGMGERQKRGYELDRPAIPYSAIPVRARNRLASELRAAGVNPTPSNIRRAYIAEQGL